MQEANDTAASGRIRSPSRGSDSTSPLDKCAPWFTWKYGTSLAVHYEATSLTNGGSSGSIHFLTPHTPATFSLTSFSSRTPHTAGKEFQSQDFFFLFLGGRRSGGWVGEAYYITHLVKLAAINTQSICQGRGKGAAEWRVLCNGACLHPVRMISYMSRWMFMET